MALSITSLVTQREDADFHEIGFKHMLEDHLTYMQKHESVTVFMPDTALRAKYKGDFYGLLKHYQFDDRYHWVIMRLNGLHASDDYTGDEESFIGINGSVVEGLLTRHRTTNSIL